jgi:hypothetical protein
VADPVEIQNVGGLRGVASEVTLLELRDAMRELNRSGSSNNSSNTSARLQDLYNRSVRESTKSNWLASKANAALDTKTGRLVASFAQGANRVSEFSTAIFGAESSLTKLTRYLDNNVDTWRELSSVGASFNNSIFDMISSAANSGMELDQYAAFIRKNSEIMKVFGGTTTLGAKRFGELGKNLRNSELGGRLFEMGFTINDINEGLINYVDLQVRLGKSETLNTKNLTQATAEYLTDLDALAKVTGKTREEFANIAEQIAADGRIRALAARAGQDGADNLTKNLASATAMLPGLGETILNISSGFLANDDMAKALETSLGSAGREFSNLIKNAGNMTEDEFIDRMANVGPALSDYLKSLDATTLAYYKTQGGVAGAIASLADMGYQFDQIAMADIQAAREEQARTDKITGTLGKFENAIINLRKMFVDSFLDLALETGGLFDAFGSLGDAIGELFGSGTKSLKGVGIRVSTSMKDFLYGLFGRSGSVTKAIRDFTTWLKSDDFKVYVNNLKESFTAFSTWISELITDIKDKGFLNTFKERLLDLGTWIKEFFLGSTVTEMTPAGPKEVQQDGLIKTITDGFSKIFNAATLSLATIIGLDTAVGADTYLDQILQRIGLDTAVGADTYLDQILQRIGLDTAVGADTYLDQIKNKILDAFLGKEVMVGREDDRQLVRQGGLFETMATAFTEFWEGPTGQSMADTIVNVFKNISEQILDYLAISFKEATGLDPFGLAFAAEGRIRENEIAKGAETASMADIEAAIEASRIEGSVAFGTATAQLSPYASEIAHELQTLRSAADLNRETPGQYDNLIAQIRDRLINELNVPEHMVPAYSNGTNGFQNFGSGTMAMLHNSEAVVPRNTPAGDLLQSFYDFQNKKVSPITSTPAASDSQSSLIKKVEELNTTMIKVAELLQSSVGLQEKTVKGVKGLGSDYYRGIGR